MADTPVLIGDVIAAQKNAEADEAKKKQAAADADAAYAAAQQTTVTAKANLKADIKLTGPAFISNPDGSITVYAPDNSDQGYTFFNPVPSSTNVPAPAPAPAPSPAPAPAP